MCGIAGIVNFKEHEDKQPLLRQMISLLRHRGPDSAGIFYSGPVGLAHARLSIIDLEGGDQPIHNEDRTVWIVFNGEIFNYPELRAELIEKGHEFYTKTDTEVIVHLYEEKGLKLFEDLNGQFAIALWDMQEEKLIIARDRVGIRPLFYHLSPQRLVFGSEIKALFADASLQRKINLETLSTVFTSWAPTHSETAFNDVFQLPPGHYAEFSKTGFRMGGSYWTLSYPEESQRNEKSVGEWAEELNTLLEDAVRIRLRADVPVGSYLSGGIDSTYISALVKQKFNNKLCTFSVGFGDKRFDESYYQRQAVAELKTEHEKIVCQDHDIGKIFPQVVWHAEVPIIRTAPAPLLMLSGLVRQNNFKVVLTGEGADELFAGYNIFKEDKVRRFWAKNPNSNFRYLLLRKIYPYIFSSDNAKAQQFLVSFFRKNIKDTHLPVYSHLLRWKNTSHLRTFFSDETAKSQKTLEQFIGDFSDKLPDGFMRWPSLSRAQYIESRIFLSNYLLSSQGDRMAMANSVEGRYPFLDHRIIEFAAKTPPTIRMRGLEEKYLLKKAADGKVPEACIARSKQPYRAPISNCFFGKNPPDYVSSLLAEDVVKDRGYFNEKKVSRLVQKCKKQNGQLLSERENMAVVGILSTQLLDDLFVKNFPAYPVRKFDQINVYSA